MGKTSKDSLLATAQELGGAAALGDRVRAGAVRTAGGEAVLLAVVADGERGPDGGPAASVVVEQVFQALEQARGGEVGAALRRGLELADQELRQRASDASPAWAVAATAVAILRNRAYTAHIGSGVALRVAGGRVSRLVSPSGGRLGAGGSPAIASGPRQGYPLDRGDRIVVASDGLFRLNPASQQPFVLPAEVGEVVEGLSPSQAARHLVSLALGRDVDDNVSVAILGLAGSASRRPEARLRRLVPAGLLLVAAGAAALAWAARSRQPAAPDYGFAVLVSGGVQQLAGDGNPRTVAVLGTIPPDSEVRAVTDARLSLQSTFEAGSDVAEGNLYLGQGASLELVSLDVHPAADAPGGGGPPATELRLGNGRLLVYRSGGTREYRVQVAGGWVRLSGAGPGAMGVEADGDHLILDCLIGACRLTPEQGDSQLLQAGQSLSTGGASGPPTSVSAAVRTRWDELCQGCLAGR